MQRVSQLFWPVLIPPKNASKSVVGVSKSQKVYLFRGVNVAGNILATFQLLTELGLVKSATNGTFQVMPLAQRSLDKLCVLVNDAMKSVNGQKISLPILTPSSLWSKSKRLDGDIAEFFMLRDRHNKEFLLSPV